MTVSEIRRQFLQFFESKGHKIVPSAPMVIKDDPTLLFTNAGMNQFKDFILGNTAPEYTRLVNSQKCLRVSGKHNDLDEVGVDTYHHTMFEMLGNWSFGDYFKREAIAWAWELLTEVYQLSADRLYVTVFEGDATDGVPMDQESIDIWKNYIANERIILASKKDNFWEMGDTGPCGPCTEIHIDLRNEEERKKIDGKQLVNADHPQVIEIWNNVFMEFNRMANGQLVPLSQKHVDTGMGLERLAMALQGKISNYDIDLFQTIIRKIEDLSSTKYLSDPNTDIALRVVADHIRAIAFAIADGQLPSNNGAGYVIRRIIRRALRYGYQNLQCKEPFLYEIIPTLVQTMGDAFAELSKQQTLIQQVIREEETSFFRTLEFGIKRIETHIEQLKKQQQTIIRGKDAFELYDTYGFPIDLTELIAREANMTVDIDAFKHELNKQKERSRHATAIEAHDWTILKDDQLEEFIGYDYLQTTVQIVKYRKVVQKQKEFYQLVFNLTPFYPQGGGQVGDSGFIESEFEKIKIFDTKKENNLILHLAEKLPEKPALKFVATVDGEKRRLATCNHSATHLLHNALKTVLGTHVEQKGSLVHPDYLRFDFSHFAKLTQQELIQVENLISEAIQKNTTLEEHRNMPIEKAKKMGATALFGEKYGDTVRVIKYGDSVELCGGTHVQSTSEIRLFKITSESSIAAGVRRIEALTAKGAENFYKKQSEIIDQLNQQFKKPKDLLRTINDLHLKNKELQKNIEKLQQKQFKILKNELKTKIIQHNTFSFLGELVDIDSSLVKELLLQLKEEHEPFVGILGTIHDESCTLSVVLSDTLQNKDQKNANFLIKNISELIGGGGGGNPTFATAKGNKIENIQKAITQIRDIFI